MLTSLHIENFRAFRNLEVDGLARVNLIAGGNSTGKTALLEGLVFFVDDPQGDKVRDLAKLFRATNPQAPGYDFWNWLLHDRSPNGGCRFMGTTTGSRKFERSWSLKRRERQPGDKHFFEVRQLGSHDGYAWGDPAPSRGFLATFSTFPGNPYQDALDFNRVILKKRRRRVEELLRQIDDRLVSIESLQSGSGPMLYADIGLPEMIPVTQLGQGFNRLLDIYSELVAEEAKLLVIDEVEGGLYWKALPVVWKGLFAAAREWDVQVFATTHSAECIRAADEAARQGGEYDLAVIRLDRVDGEIKATTMGEETLRTAKEFNWELR